MGNLVQLDSHTRDRVSRVSQPRQCSSQPAANIQQMISSSPPPNNNTITASQHPPNSYKLGWDTVCTSHLWELLQNFILIIKEMEIIIDDCHWCKVVSQQRRKSPLAGWNVITRVRIEPVMGLTIVLGPGLFLEQAHHQFSRTENTSYSCLVLVQGACPLILISSKHQQ